MNILDELIQDAFDNTKLLSASIRKLRPLIKSTRHIEISAWVDKELAGYAPISYDGLPKYRQGQGTIKAHDPRFGWLPIQMSKDHAELWSRVPITFSIEKLENLLKDVDSELVFQLPKDQADILKSALTPKRDVAIFIPHADLNFVLADMRHQLIEYVLCLKQFGIESLNDVA